MAREHGYVVNAAASNLRRQTTHTIGLVLPMGHETGQQIRDPFLLEFIGCLADEVIRHGYDLLLSKIPNPCYGWLTDLIQSHRFDGMLVLGQSDQHAAINEAALKYKAMVVWGERLPEQNYCSVGVDNLFGGRLATEHLLGGGCQDVLFLGPPNVPEVVGRYQGYVKAIHDLNARQKSTDLVETHFTYESAFETVRSLIKARRKFDGLFCASDVIAQGAIAALIDSGRRVPEDVAVCGFDDVPLARSLSPSLTTVKQDLEMGARFMVDLLFQRIQGEMTSSAVIPASLVVRQSTRSPA